MTTPTSSAPFDSWKGDRLATTPKKGTGTTVEVSKIATNAPFGAWHGDRLNSKKDPSVIDDEQGQTVVEPLWMKPLKPLLFCTGTMPEYQDFLYTERGHPGITATLWVLRCFDAALRGVGQVMFLNNPITGLIVMIAVAIQSWEMALTGTIGMIASTVMALAMKLNPSAIRNGLFSYNGAIIGIAFAALFDIKSVTTIATVIITSIFSTILQLSLGNMLIPKYGVPPFTVPFNICMYAIFMGSYGYTRVNFISDALKPELPVPIVNEFTLDWLQLLAAVFRGIGQIYLCDKYYVGALIWIATIICSPIAAAMCIVGSVTGILTAIVLGCSGAEIYAGIWGYNAVLGAIAIGGMFYLLNWRTALLAIYCAIICTFSNGFFKTLFLPWGVPPLSFPFCLGAMIFVFTQGSIGGVEPIELTDITTAEGNWRRWWIMHHLQEPVRAPSYPESGEQHADDLSPESASVNSSVEISLEADPIESSQDFKSHEVEMGHF